MPGVLGKPRSQRVGTEASCMTLCDGISSHDGRTCLDVMGAAWCVECGRLDIVEPDSRVRHPAMVVCVRCVGAMVDKMRRHET